MIFIEPHSGLANRMRSIASAKWLASQTNEQLCIVWNKNHELNCKFHDLFEPVTGISIIRKPLKNKFLKASLQENPKKRFLSNVINRLLGQKLVIKDQDFRKYFWNNKLNVIDLLKKHGSIYFQTCEEFSNSISVSDIFVPEKQLKNIIQKRISNFDENTFGLHIRRTDNEWAIKNSPTKLFIETIEKKQKDNPKAKFYLATDDPNTEHELKSLFGACIITYQKEFSRESEQGIKDALVELFCLASTQKIYGSYWSSFSNVASRLKNIPFEILKT